MAERSSCPSDSQSSGPGFESRSDHYLGLFLDSPEFNRGVFGLTAKASEKSHYNNRYF